MKRFTKAIALLVVLSLALTACTSDSGSTTSQGTAASSGNTAASSEGSGTAAADPSGVEDGASLVYWTMWNEGEPQGRVIADAAAAFTAATGVKMDVNFMGREIRDTLEPALAAGESIDLFDEDVDRVINNWGQYLLPLDSYVNEVYGDTGGRPYRDMVSKTLVDLAQDLGGGSVRHIPYQPFIFTTMYNKDLFDAAGITSTPKTWSEFLDVCAQLKANDITPITVDDAYMAALFGYTLSRVVGAEKCAEIAGNMDFSDPGVLRACEIWEHMAKEGYLSSRAATNVWPSGQINEFAQHSVAMYLNGTWLPNEISEQTGPDFRWGSFAWPAIDAGGDGIEAHNYGGQSFGINKDTRYPNAAFAFIRWMTVGEWDTKLASESMGAPMANDATWPPQLAEAKAVFDASSTRLAWAAHMEDDPEINATIKDGLARLVTGDFTAQDFANALASLSR